MEVEGLKRCLDHLQQEQVTIAKLATDRHVEVRVHIKEERPDVQFWRILLVFYLIRTFFNRFFVIYVLSAISPHFKNYTL